MPTETFNFVGNITENGNRVIHGANTSGSGNVLTGVSSSDGVLTFTLGSGGGVQFQTTGSGNSVTDVSESNGTVTITKGDRLVSMSTTGSGQVVTDISESSGVVNATKGDIYVSGTTQPTSPCIWFQQLSTGTNIGYGTID